MKIEAARTVTTTTTVHTLTITDCPDLVRKDWTEQLFRPVRMTVTIINGVTDAFTLSGPRHLKSGRAGEILTQRFYPDGVSLGGERAPRWAVDTVKGLQP